MKWLNDLWCWLGFHAWRASGKWPLHLPPLMEDVRTHCVCDHCGEESLQAKQP